MPIRDKNIALNASIFPGKVAGFGMGEVFYVCQSANTDAYGWLNARVPADNLFTTIQAAADATKESRNDYIFVWSDNSDYDLTTTVTLSKKDVHLIGVGGFGYDVGCTNAVKIHQTGAYPAFTVTDSNVEIAGFWIKNYANKQAILTSGASYCLNYHHNNFQMYFSSSPKAIVDFDDAAGSWGYLCHHCNFIVYAASGTIAKIVETGDGGGGYVCNHNNFQIHGGCTATTCIDLTGGSGSCANFNTFGTGGGASGGTITDCITIGVSDSTIGNRGTVEAGSVIVGGTAVKSYSMNYCHDVVDET